MWVVQPLELIPSGSECLFCYTVSPAGWNKTATPPTLFLIRICPSLYSAFHSASSMPLSVFPRSLSTNLPRSHTLIIPITPSGSPRKHSTRHSLALVKVMLPFWRVRCLWTSTIFNRQSLNHNGLYIYGLYLQFCTVVQPSSDGSNKIIS